jgi:excinuclease ABC subunit A
MFLGQMDKPEVDSIEGLSPAISIDQKTTSKNPRSTVGTVTEIYDYLRLLYARVGVPHCPICNKEIRRQSTDQIIDKIMALPERTKFMVLAPVVRSKKGQHEKVFESAKKSGFARVRVDGILYDLQESIELEKNNKHTVEIVVDRLVLKEDIRSRLADSVETALTQAEGNLCIAVMGEKEENLYFSQNYACEEHNISFGELEPRMFSFNNPIGACPVCAGLGVTSAISPAKVIPDMRLTLREGAIAVNGFKTLDETTYAGPLYEAAGRYAGFDFDTPIKDLSPEALNALLYGTGDKLYSVTRAFDGKVKHQTVPFEGVLKTINQRGNMWKDVYYDQFYEETPCTECGGKRLKPEILSVTVGDKNIDDFCKMSVTGALDFVNSLVFDGAELKISAPLLF